MCKSEQGFSLTELLITMAIVSVALAGAYSSFLSSSKPLVLQNEVVEMQTDARAAMDFMVRELRLAYGAPALSTTVTANDTITFDRIEDSGYASGSAATTLTDIRKSWSNNGLKNYTVRIISGTGAGQAVQSIISNTSTQLTISALGWTTQPDASSVYVITRNKAFTRTSASDNILRYTVGGSVNQPLADLITSHAFSQPDPNTISVTLTAQTKNVDLNTGQKRQYTLTETVLRRNN